MFRRHLIVRRSVTALAPGLLAAGLLAGCTAAPAGSGPERDLTDAESRQLAVAQQELVQRCMLERGFRYEPSPPPQLPDQGDFPYVVTDAAWAARHGYGRDLDAQLDALLAAEPNGRYLQTLPAPQRAAQLAALNGDPVGDSGHEQTVRLPSGDTVHRDGRSCQSVADGQLYGDAAEWFRLSRLMDALVQLRQPAVVADPAVVAATKEWSRCMARAGHPARDPGQARDLVAGLPPLDRREVATAVAEAHCATGSGLARATDAADVRERDRLRGRYAAQFHRWRQLRLRALAH